MVTEYSGQLETGSRILTGIRLYSVENRSLFDDVFKL
jgi:hypothetical protein